VDELETIAQAIRSDFAAQNEVRDSALRTSRELIRICATAIRASHRNDWDDARALLQDADKLAAEIGAILEPHPQLYFAGYTQDALKELVEAHATIAMANGAPVPSPDELTVSGATYLNGICEAASEMRRRCLDELRRGSVEEAQRLLEAMDAVYDVLVSFDFPDAITGGLRRRVDQLRGVLERTRGDLTNSLRQERLVKTLEEFEERLGQD
jgi:translin